MDYKALADALISALRDSTNSQLNLTDMNRRNYFEDINNRGAKRGTLFSTAGANQRSRYDAGTYLPARAGLQGSQQQKELNIKNDLLTTASKIEAMKKAAAELNAIDDNYFNSLLV